MSSSVRIENKPNFSLNRFKPMWHHIVPKNFGKIKICSKIILNINHISTNYFNTQRFNSKISKLL